VSAREEQGFSEMSQQFDAWMEEWKGWCWGTIARRFDGKGEELGEC
jgi:hypothetical protein